KLGASCWSSLVFGSRSRYLASAPASYSAMRVASEQASGEKYKSMDASLAVWPVNFELVDFYTVSHIINQVKEFIAKWYKKGRSRHLVPKSMRQRRSAAGGRAPTSPMSRSARRSI